METKEDFGKEVEFDELVKIIGELKKRGKKVILSHGVFDIVHPGHIQHLEFAKKKADILIVTLTQDEYVNKGPGRPVFNENLRAQSIAALGCVDYVAINKWPTAVETILHLKPDFYIKGVEYKKRGDDITGKIIDEENAVKSIGGELVFSDEIVFSSSELLNKYFNVYSKEANLFLEGFKKKYSSDDIINILKSLKDLKVLIIGDVIIDEYHYCKGMGKSQKADIVTTKYINEEKFTGGVLAAAKHISNFCGEVCLVSVIGRKNNYGGFILDNLEPDIKSKFFYREDAPTIVKRRFVNPVSLNKTFEINFINDSPIPKSVSKEICEYLNKVIEDYDVVIAADFGHGLITDDIVDVLCNKANFLAVNTQTNSANLGHNLVTKYPRADFICIDEVELRLAMHDKFGDIKKNILKLSEKLKCDKITITRGENGSISYEKDKGFSNIPIFSGEVIDSIGAGDAFLSIASPVVAKGYSLETVGFIGNAVGALAVLIVGNKTSVGKVPLLKFITSLLK